MVRDAAQATMTLRGVAMAGNLLTQDQREGPIKEVYG